MFARNTRQSLKWLQRLPGKRQRRRVQLSIQLKYSRDGRLTTSPTMTSESMGGSRCRHGYGARAEPLPLPLFQWSESPPYWLRGLERWPVRLRSHDQIEGLQNGQAPAPAFPRLRHAVGGEARPVCSRGSIAGADGSSPCLWRPSGYRNGGLGAGWVRGWWSDRSPA